MEYFMAGMIAALNGVIALIFLRFWRDTHDRLFLMFSLAFLALGLSRFRSFIAIDSPWHILPHIVRFLAFLTILIAVIDKNFQNRAQR
jgi:hypothetical protein